MSMRIKTFFTSSGTEILAGLCISNLEICRGEHENKNKLKNKKKTKKYISLKEIKSFIPNLF